jgi:Holliday junction resolvasome RuvABC ATP-dependent DNA helicase subunit
MLERVNALFDVPPVSAQEVHGSILSLAISFFASDFELSNAVDENWGTSELATFESLIQDLADVKGIDPKLVFESGVESFDAAKFTYVSWLCRCAAILEISYQDESISDIATNALNFVADCISLSGVTELEIHDFAAVAAMFHVIEYEIYGIRTSGLEADMAIAKSLEFIDSLETVSSSDLFAAATELIEDGHPYPRGSYKNDRMWEIFCQSLEAVDFSEVDVSEFDSVQNMDTSTDAKIQTDGTTRHTISTATEAAALVKEHNKTESSDNRPSPSLQQLLDELDALVGLESVKDEVRRLASRASIDKKRREAGLSVAAPTRHLVFVGNPGTGKTSVARVLAGIYREAGLLRNGQLIEVGKSELVASYLGQTSSKVTAVVEKALGGVLFIDEAYSLKTREDDSYGQEAIDTLVALMENHREDLIVIVAGYPKEMDDFIALNPGLASRFPRTISFPDYAPEELVDIFLRMITKAEYQADQEAKKSAAAYLITKGRTTGFGNARGVRNLFDVVIDSQSTRIASFDDPSRDDLILITATDIPLAE